MVIKKYIQGKSNDNIFCSVGNWLTDKKVHEQLGMAITSQEGDTWYIVLLNDIVIGFAVTRNIVSNKGVHIRFIYTDDKTKKVLIKKIMDEAIKEKNNIIYTNDRKQEKVWKELGFSFKPRSRGEFGRWEKILDNSKEKKDGKK